MVLGFGILGSSATPFARSSSKAKASWCRLIGPDNSIISNRNIRAAAAAPHSRAMRFLGFVSRSPFVANPKRLRFPTSSASMASLPSAANFVTLSRPRLRGVVFDMDGTLTVPVIDFPAMYRAVLGEEEYLAVKTKNPSGIDILHHIETWSADKQQNAYEVIAEFERLGLDRLQIMPGALELCSFLDEKKIRRGLITRNVKEAVDLFHTRFGLKFLPALSREFRPYKPDPAPLLSICSAWGILPSEVIMIGDSLKDDVACGKRAGAFACLLDETGRYKSPEYANVELKPDFTVSSLAQINSLLEENFDLSP